MNRQTKYTTLYVVLAVALLFTCWGSGYYTGRVDGVAFAPIVQQEPEVIIAYEEEACERNHVDDDMFNEALDIAYADGMDVGYQAGHEDGLTEGKESVEPVVVTRVQEVEVYPSRADMIQTLELGEISLEQILQFEEEGVGYGRIYITP